MRDTKWNGHTQKMTMIQNGKLVPKGLRQVLEERQLIGPTQKIKKQEMQTILSNCEDFKAAKCIIDEFISSRGHIFKLLP